MTGIEQKGIGVAAGSGAGARRRERGGRPSIAARARVHHTIRFQQLSSTQYKSRSIPFSSSRVVWDTSSQ